MELKPIKALKKGEYFKRKADAKTVFVRGNYVRETKRFAACDFDDICRYVYLRPDTLVVVGFDF
jgi:hypothetical protein